jgi:hypothetical protein
MAASYAEFLATKRRVWTGTGVTAGRLPSLLHDWQAAIVRWALSKGRAAIFADCGLGKTFMQVAWADALPGRVLFLAPLCVAEQTVAEAAKLGVEVRYARSREEAADARLVIANYERLDKFDTAAFCGVVLDESSILKAFDGKTRTHLIETFRDTSYRLCCTATPSPNDVSELANHAEFLGLMTRPEFLATWFIREQEGAAGWRMKRHAVEPFYRWMASWAVALRRPSDIGPFDDTGFVLPPLHIRERIVETDGKVEGALFPEAGLKGIQGRLATRRATLADRVAAVADLVTDDEQWICWCGLNAESAALVAAIPGAVEVRGDHTYAEKAAAVRGFVDGSIRVLVSKTEILGFGLNFQNCAREAFVGLSDSYERYYQAIRRCWRYGQTRSVEAWLVVSEAERLIVENVRRKEAKADALASNLLTHMSAFEREELAS